jgi:hypothetical protein
MHVSSAWQRVRCMVHCFALLRSSTVVWLWELVVRELLRQALRQCAANLRAGLSLYWQHVGCKGVQDLHKGCPRILGLCSGNTGSC